MRITKGILFQDRDGQTQLSIKEKEGLKLKHITLMSELDEVEQRNINEGLMWLAKQKFTNSDYLEDTFLKQFHKKLFGDVWKWAGEFRHTEKNIGVPYYQIPVAISQFGDDVRYWLENKTYSENEITARVHHRLVFIHPFPNGNGRFSRLYTHFFCKQNNLKEPNWSLSLECSERRKLYIDCLRKADTTKRFSDLIKFMNPQT